MSQSVAIAKAGHDIDSGVELHRIITAGLIRRFGLSEFCASVLATEIAHEFRREVGGAPLYVPAIDKDQRNAAIRGAFKGNNYDELAHEWGLSRRQIQNIVNAR